eukprot:TRINITY_DN3206_c0_g2_i5.p1 TRINITY_DN3206_c0_g2~~TRINITY_DN3206_c0_g2_i5.p1  ORF type:complete len:383 (+),score=76.74 TRINITY_DN3206_c0_g2_i5:113-1261(+)
MGRRKRSKSRKKIHKPPTLLQHINKILEGKINKTSITELREIANSCGLVNKTIRRKVWPLLLGIKTTKFPHFEHKVVPHNYTEQVAKDVDRSLWKLVPDNERMKKRTELSNIINAVLAENPDLHYFQGYHDIASVLLLVCGPRCAYVLLRKISLFFIRDHMNDKMMEGTTDILNNLQPLLTLVDPEVSEILARTGVPPFFCLSWILTWFSHSVEELDVICRLFDFFLSANPYASLYMTVAIVVTKAEGLKTCSPDEMFAHKYLSELPHNMPWESLIRQTRLYLELYPPHSSESLLLPPPNSKIDLSNFFEALKEGEGDGEDEDEDEEEEDEREDEGETNFWVGRVPWIVVAVGVLVAVAVSCHYSAEPQKWEEPSSVHTYIQ